LTFLKEWNVIPLALNAKFPPLLKNWQQVRYDRETLKSHVGNVGIGTGIISDNLYVFDWDFREGQKKEGFKLIFKEYEKTFPSLSRTRIAETPHGFHFYYKIKNMKEITEACEKENKETPFNNKSLKNAGYSDTFKKFYNKNETRFGKYLKGIDTRGVGGYVVAPPSVVNDERYEWKTVDPPLEITINEWIKIMDFFDNPAPRVIRAGFVEILMGKLDPHILKQKGKEEHVYWKELYHELVTCCKIEPEMVFAGLQHHQKSFDIDETIKQLNDSKNREYIYNGSVLSKEKYAQYFPEKNGLEKTWKKEEFKKESIFDDGERDDYYLDGTGFVYMKENGLYWDREIGKNVQAVQISKNKFVIHKVSYDAQNNNRLLLTGTIGKITFRTMRLDDFMGLMNDYAFKGNVGRDCIRYYIHKEIEKMNVHNLSYVLGFNSHWNLPFLEEEQGLQIYTATDIQRKAYVQAKSIYKEYKPKTKVIIQKLMQEFIKRTQMDDVKLSIIIGWCIAAPFRHAIINRYGLFPLLCLYGKKSTGKSKVLEFFSTFFYGVHESHKASIILDSKSQLEDNLSASSFPIFIEEVKNIYKEILSLIKEHATGSSPFERKRSARELDFSCLKSAGLAFDCNDLPENLRDPAMNTKLVTVEYTNDDLIELDPEWTDLMDKLLKYKLFSLLYERTKEWMDKDVIESLETFRSEIMTAIQEHSPDIEKNNPRIIQQYIIIAFGLELFNEIFGTKFKRKAVVHELLESRTIMTRGILDDFHAYCSEALKYKENGKNPNYLQHPLESYNTRELGGGWFFTTKNKSDLQRLTGDKYSLDGLVDNLKDALPEGEKHIIKYHRTGHIRGIFIHVDFFKYMNKNK